MEYPSATHSKKLIRKAYFDLLQEKDAAKVTVTDIVRRANINRATFYAHYPDVRGLIVEIEDETIAKLTDVLDGFEYDSFFRQPEHLLSKLTGYLAEDEAEFRILVRLSSVEPFLERLKDVFVHYMKNDRDAPEFVRNSADYELWLRFFAGGAVSLYQRYLRDEVKCTLADIEREISQMARCWASTFDAKPPVATTK